MKFTVNTDSREIKFQHGTNKEEATAIARAIEDAMGWRFNSAKVTICTPPKPNVADLPDFLKGIFQR